MQGFRRGLKETLLLRGAYFFQGDNLKLVFKYHTILFNITLIEKARGQALDTVSKRLRLCLYFIEGFAIHRENFK